MASIELMEIVVAVKCCQFSRTALPILSNCFAWFTQDLAHNHDLKIRALVALLVTKLTEKLKHKMDYLDGINAKLEHQTKQV